MPFREKSAWVMSAALIVGGIVYFRAVLSAWSESGELLSPEIPLILTYTGVLVVIAVVGHIVAVAFAPDDADAPIDERESQILIRAGHYSSYVFAAGIVMSLGLYIYANSGDLLFYAVFACLLLSQIVEYLFQILYFRTSV